MEPAGESTGTNWRPRFSQPVRHRDHDLAGELVGVGLRPWRRRRPRRWRARRARRRRRRGWCPARARRPGRPSARGARRRPARHVPAPASPSVTRWPDAASRVAIPRPAGPVPPNTPMCMSESFAQPDPDPPPPRPPTNISRFACACDGRAPRCSRGVTPRCVARPSEVPDVLAAIGRQQHGLLTRAQALAVMSLVDARPLETSRTARADPARRLPDGRLPGDLGAAAARRVPRAGPEARASFRAAAALHGLEGFARTGLEITHFGAPTVAHRRGRDPRDERVRHRGTSPGSTASR